MEDLHYDMDDLLADADEINDVSIGEGTRGTKEKEIPFPNPQGKRSAGGSFL